MFIFLRLLLAHFIGDFPLQFDKIYELKHKGLAGILPHVLIIMGCYIALSWPYLNRPGFWGFLFFLSIIHLFQDSIKLSYKGMKYAFWFYILDQIGHIALISVVLLTGMKNLLPPENPDNLLVSLYNNNLLVIYLIAVIIASFNGHFMIRIFKSTFFRKPYPINTFEKWLGMLERTALVSIFLVEKYLFIFISGVLLLRPLIFMLGRKKLKPNQEFNIGTEAILSWTVGIVTGLLFCFIKRNLL